MNNLRSAKRALFWFGLLKIPMIGFVRPRLEQIDMGSCLLRIPLRRRTRNHLGGMYLGAYAVGADLACGFLAFFQIQQKKLKVSLAFKSLHCDFERRAESDVYFSCEAGERIEALIAESERTGERVNEPIAVEAYVVNTSGEKEVVAQITIELSLKIKSPTG